MEAGQTRYTLAELCAAARVAGFDPSERLVKDWVGLGLLDQAQRRGRGRGRGVEATWPESQKNLFLLLLTKRQELTRVAGLCNIPVAIWLWWGDEQVPARQALRALSTWARTQGRASGGPARATAEELVKQYAATDSPKSERGRLTTLITRAASGGEFDADGVRDAFNAIVDPRWTRPPLPTTGDTIVFLTEARLTAIRWLKAKTVQLEALHLAGAEYRTTRRDYEENLLKWIKATPDLADAILERSTSGRLLLAQTTEQLLNTACLDLLTLLGIHLLGIEHGRQETG
jgi:hypothetical protein